MLQHTPVQAANHLQQLHVLVAVDVLTGVVFTVEVRNAHSCIGCLPPRGTLISHRAGMLLWMLLLSTCYYKTGGLEVFGHARVPSSQNVALFSFF